MLIRGVVSSPVRGVVGSGFGEGGDPLLSLFANGEQGFLFDGFSDLSQLFTTAAGSTNVAANNDPVGRAVARAGGNNATAANDAFRPVWIASSGKPYLQPDGSDDRLATGFLPNASGAGLTLAFAGRINADNQAAIGGGASNNSKRAFLALTNEGRASFGWGTSVSAGDNLHGQNITMLMTGDGAGRRGWVNGVEITLAPPVGAPDGTGGGIALCAYNNAGVTASFQAGRLYGALALNRKLTAAEIPAVNTRLGALL